MKYAPNCRVQEANQGQKVSKEYKGKMVLLVNKVRRAEKEKQEHRVNRDLKVTLQRLDTKVPKAKKGTLVIWVPGD
jgi:hypothetical protein